MDVQRTARRQLPIAATVAGTAVVVAAGWVSVAICQQAEPQAESREQQLVAAAYVDDDPVYLSEVEREVKRVLGQRQATPEALELMRAQALEQLIKRRLILHYLQQKHWAATDQDLDLALAKLNRRLGQQQLTLQSYLQQTGVTPQEMRRALAWQLSWQRYLQRYLTDQNLQRYFDTHRRQFDGSELHVAHILLKVDEDAPREAWEAARQRAKEIRKKIVAQQISFADAARRWSAAPSNNRGGDLGWIRRHEPMPESFSRAAFKLQPGQISLPVTTAFGVHLIQCLEVKAGKKTWDEVRAQLITAVTQYLFDWTANQQRGRATIRYTGALDHLKPRPQQPAP